nr:MAG TPA: hypothetical protein [Caudoviricetes sp.]
MDILINLEKVGIGAALFLGAYISNILFGIWKNVKISGYAFNWRLVLESVLKYIILGVGIAMLSIVISAVPQYATYVGIEIGQDTIELIDSVVIIGAFLTATLRYSVDSISKLKDILS